MPVIGFCQFHAAIPLTDPRTGQSPHDLTNDLPLLPTSVERVLFCITSRPVSVCLSVCLFDTVSCSDGVIVMSSRHDDYKYAQFRGEFPCCAVHCRSSCSVLQRGKAALIASVVHYSSPTSVLIY